MREAGRTKFVSAWCLPLRFSFGDALRVTCGWALRMAAWDGADVLNFKLYGTQTSLMELAETAAAYGAAVDAVFLLK